MGDYGWPDGSTGLIISTGNAAGVPSGNVIRLVADLAGGSDSPGQKITNVAGGNSFAPKTGEYVIKVYFKNCVVIAGESDSENTKEFSNILTKLRDMHKSAASPFYMWIYSLIDSDYVKIGYAKGAEADYLKGYLDKGGLVWEVKPGNVYYFKSLTFIGCDN